MKRLREYIIWLVVAVISGALTAVVFDWNILICVVSSLITIVFSFVVSYFILVLGKVLDDYVKRTEKV